MRLIPHPDYPHVAAAGVDVAAERKGGHLMLRYSLSGTISEIALPTPVTPARADELWKHTCFEVFLRPAEGEAYCEFNFSASGLWAAYRFRTRRSGMANIAEVEAPTASMWVTRDLVTFEAALDLAALPDLPAAAPWRIALTTIVEEADTSKSFWSLAHPQGKPDFHHADNFALTLAP